MKDYSPDILVSSFSEFIATCQNEFHRLTLEELNFKRNPSSWSVLECLEHLNRYCEYYNPAIKEALQKAQEFHGSQKIRLSWFAKKGIKQVKVDNRRKLKTFGRMNPSGSNLNQSSIERFIQFNKELISYSEEAQNLNVNQKLIKVEFLKWVKFSLVETLIFMKEHQNRHVGQALRILPLLVKEEESNLNS